MVYTCSTVVSLALILFFKQKTAYEMRISDWSSDVCSSDLLVVVVSLEVIEDVARQIAGVVEQALRRRRAGEECFEQMRNVGDLVEEIGRASCRERVCEDV